MKRLLVLLFVALAVPGSALAALSGGGGTTIANGQATLVSNATSPYSYLSFDDLNGQPVDSLTELSADVAWATWGGGSPRFSVEVSNGTTTKDIFVYLGDLPNYTTSATTGDTGNLLNADVNGARVDSTQVGGPFYGTWSDAVTAAHDGDYGTITDVSFVVDGDWAQPSGSQTVVLDNASINGVVYDFTAAAKSDCKDGNWQTLGYKNQGACISSVETGH